MGLDGYAMLAILTLFFVYLLPSVIRSAQIVAEARIEDRFSSDLQIIATAGERQEKAPSQGRTYIHPPRNSEHPMNTPVARKYAAGDQRRVAVARAARAAAASRRAAAAKRRMLLLTVLGALTLSGWVLSAMTSFPWLIPAVLTAATVGVVELGRRAAVAGQQADAELAEKVRVAEAKAEANADARRPKKHARVVETTATVVEQAPVSSLRVETEVEESTWTPVPVPPPAYTLKAEVRRKIAEPYEDSAPAAPAARVAEPAPEASPAPVVQKPTTEEPAAEETATLNVQEILARRRAVG